MWRKTGECAISSSGFNHSWLDELHVVAEHHRRLSAGYAIRRDWGIRVGYAMLGRLVFLAGLAVILPAVQAHRLDEYLQATLIGIEPSEIRTQLSLTPGTAVAGTVIAAIDQNQDGSLSEDEKRAYVVRLESELSLSLDGRALTMEIVATQFPPLEAVREGAGIIELQWLAKAPGTQPGPHVLHFQNRHLTNCSVYLVNALAPTTSQMVIGRQQRDYLQRNVEIAYTLAEKSGVGRGRQHAVNETLHKPWIWWMTGGLSLFSFLWFRGKRKNE
jgi:hypothetical protein